MTAITNPVPGTAMSQGVLAGDTQTLAIGTSSTNGDAIAYNARWQWNLTGAESTANAGSNLQLQAIADDGFTVVATAISVNRSTGAVTITGGGATEYFADGSVSAPSIANTTNHASGVYFTTNAVNITANGVRALQLATATTGVNYLVATPAAAGSAVSLSAAGTDTDIGLLLIPKGAGVVALGGATAAAAGLQVPIVASAVDYLSVSGSTTGNHNVLVAAAGTDSNISLNLAGKGTGTVNLATIGTITGTSAQTLNGQCGIVTTGTLTTAAATAATYVINNSSVTTASLVQVTNQGYSGTLVTNGYPVIFSAVPGTGTITINFANTHAANALNGTLKFGFTVFN